MLCFTRAPVTVPYTNPYPFIRDPPDTDKVPTDPSDAELDAFRKDPAPPVDYSVYLEASLLDL